MKIIVLILLIIFPTINFSYAEDDCSSCTIKDSPAEAIQKFIENQRKILTRISSKAAGKKDNLSIDSVSKNFNSTFNYVIDFHSYFDSFEYIKLELFTSVPSAIRRDKTKLDNEYTNLQNQMERSIKRKYSGVSLTNKDICDGIDNCKLSGTVLSIFTELAKNNSNIISLYENSITGTNTVKEDFIIVPDTFYEDMIHSYNKTTLMSCSTCQGGFTENVNTQIDNISKNMKTAGDATRYWKDGWNLLTGNVSDANLKKLEKDLLTKELAKQGLTKDQSKIILDNLDKYYDKTGGGFSTENNFIVNTLSNISNSLGKYIDSFKEAIRAWGEKNKNDKEKTVTPGELTNEKIKLETTEEMYLNMQKVYAELVKEASMQSIVDEKSINKLIIIHATLAKTVSNLEKTVEPSQSVCKKQCSGIGNCTDY